jgi:alpha-glucosidase
VEDLRADDDSILHLYGRLLRARRDSAALRSGSFRLLPASDGALAWERAAESDRRLVAVSFTDAAVDIELSGEWVVEVASDGQGEGERATGRLAPNQAVILREASALEQPRGRA